MSDTTKPKKAKANDSGFSAEERAAMKARAKELKAQASREEAEKAVLKAIDEMPEPDQSIARRLHDIVKANAPDLNPKTWYGMPAYANKDGKVVCFFQAASKFDTRYSTFGFNDSANMDDGALFPVAFAIKALSDAEEERIAALVKQAVSPRD